MTTVIGYIRVSTQDQFLEGGGLDAQRASIRAECDRRGWELVDIMGEPHGISAEEIDRPGLNAVVASMDAGAAEVLMVAAYDRISRNMWQGIKFSEDVKAKTRNRKRKAQWAIVAMADGLDMTRDGGDEFLFLYAWKAQRERADISRRTRAGMAAKKAAGTLKGPIGRPAGVSDELAQRILEMRTAGLSYRRIADTLQSEGVPTAHGSRATRNPAKVQASVWRPGTVKQIVDRISC